MQLLPVYRCCGSGCPVHHTGISLAVVQLRCLTWGCKSHLLLAPKSWCSDVWCVGTCIPFDHRFVVLPVIIWEKQSSFAKPCSAPTEVCEHSQCLLEQP